MNANLLNIVKRIVAEQGEGILADTPRLRAFFMDYAKDEPRQERLAFGRCIELGSYAELKKARTPEERLRKKAVMADYLNSKTGIDRDLCADAFDLLETVMFGGANGLTPGTHSGQPARAAASAVSAGAPRTSLFCANCAAQLPAGAKFCMGCAAPVPVLGPVSSPEPASSLTLTDWGDDSEAPPSASWPLPGRDDGPETPSRSMSRQGRKRKPAFYALIAGAGLVLVAALVLVLVLWSGNDDAFFGETLHLTGQVWEGWDEDGRRIQFTGTRTLTSNLGGTGGIVGGQLDFTVGRPADEHFLSIVEMVRSFESAGWEQVSVSPAAARFAQLEMEIPNGWFGRGSETRYKDGFVLYIFVDRNVTISAEARTVTDPWRSVGRYEAFNITFREGWNALYYRGEAIEPRNGVTWISSLSHADPDYVKWGLDEWGPRDDWDW